MTANGHVFVKSTYSAENFRPFAIKKRIAEPITLENVPYFIYPITEMLKHPFFMLFTFRFGNVFFNYKFQQRTW